MDTSSEPANGPSAAVAVVPIGAGMPEATTSARRELAYQLWAWEHAENCAAVAAALGLSARAVQKWRHQEGWDARLDREAAALRGQLVATTQRRLLFGAVRVVGVLERVALGLGDDGAAPSPPIPWQTRVNAAKEFLAVAGYARGAAPPTPPAAPAWPSTAAADRALPPAEPEEAWGDLITGWDPDGGAA